MSRLFLAIIVALGIVVISYYAGTRIRYLYDKSFMAYSQGKEHLALWYLFLCFVCFSLLMCAVSVFSGAIPDIMRFV